jgi:hypothetical protein
VAETRPALELLGRLLQTLAIRDCLWYLDRPVSNSGRLKVLIEQVATANSWPWRVELVPNPDAVLPQAPAGVVVVTADSAVLDRCGPWFNLAGAAMAELLSNAEVLNLGQMQSG